MRKYFTTTLPYINSDPHLGFALEIIQTDILARHFRLNGNEVFFNTGTDEHGAKIWEKSQGDPKAFCDLASQKFRDLIPVCYIS
jgi:methionyl-tRNA synthetase